MPHSHTVTLLYYYYITVHSTLNAPFTLHTESQTHEGAWGCTDSCSIAVLALIPIPKEGLPIMLLPSSLSLTSLLAGPFHLELLRAVTPPLVLVE